MKTDGEQTLVWGWISQPDNRGTFDVAASCAITIFLCSWSCICVNIPSPTHGKRDLFWDKWYMFCLSILGPEFIFMLALGQHFSARASVKAFHRLGYHDWTLKHAFYADVGGFIFEPCDWKAFPINAKQLLYLVERGYVHYPALDKTVLDDKDKSDGLARSVESRSPFSSSLIFLSLLRFITTCQLTWFTLNVIARPPQGLAVTTLEVTTVAFVFCTLCTNFCWRKKPMDVCTATVLQSEVTIESIILEAATTRSKQLYYRSTPLDFVDPDEWIGIRLWHFNVNLLKRLRFYRSRHPTRPVQRLSSFSFPDLSRSEALIAFAVALLYSAIFLSVWNYDFPSQAERLIWHICTSLTISLTLVVGVIEITGISSTGQPQLQPQGDEFAEDPPSETASPRKPNLPRRLLAAALKRGGGQEGKPNRFNTTSTSRIYHEKTKRPTITALDVPLKSLLLTEPICAIYTVCRVMVIVEDIISLRALPASTFQCVNWTAYWPHF